MTRHRLDQDGDGDFDIYDLILLVLGLGIACGLWYASMTWSVDGFEIATTSDRSWIGWLLGFTVTYLQVMFNRGSKNETLWWFGIAAYCYGFATNIAGIISARTEPVIVSDYMATGLNILILIFMSAITEWVPEHLVVRLLRANKDRESDFVSEFRKGVQQFQKGKSKGQQPKQQQPQMPPRNQGNQGGRNDNRPRNNQQGGNGQPFVPDFSDLPDLRRRD